MAALLAAIAGVGLVMDATGRIKAGHQQQLIGRVNARSITDIGEQNAQLIEQGSELNAGVFDFNAAALEGQATDAVTRGQQMETRFRQQVRGFIGTQRTNYAAQGVDIADGSPVDVTTDSARQGEMDALQIRTDAAREAWGYRVEAQGQRLQAASTRRLGKLQAQNTRDVARTNALNALVGGNVAASNANWGAASTLLGGGANLALNYYNYKQRTS